MIQSLHIILGYMYKTPHISKKNIKKQHISFAFYSGADLRISRGGVGEDFQKNFENFVDLFLGRPN